MRCFPFSQESVLPFHVVHVCFHMMLYGPSSPSGHLGSILLVLIGLKLTSCVCPVGAAGTRHLQRRVFPLHLLPKLSHSCHHQHTGRFWRIHTGPLLTLSVLIII